MKKKIKSLVRKACNRIFRKMFESAYPDGAKFLEGIRADKDRDGNKCFGIDSGFYSKSFISAKGINQ